MLKKLYLLYYELLVLVTINLSSSIEIIRKILCYDVKVLDLKAIELQIVVNYLQKK